MAHAFPRRVNRYLGMYSHTPTYIVRDFASGSLGITVHINLGLFPFLHQLDIFDGIFSRLAREHVRVEKRYHWYYDIVPFNAHKTAAPVHRMRLQLVHG